jgi:hypothetical protein
MDLPLFPFVAVLVGWLFLFLIGLVFVMLAARLAARAVLDEIDKDRRRRGPV